MMQCAEVVGETSPLQVVKKEKHATPPAGLLLRTSYAGVCHSDIHIMKSVHEAGLRQYLRTIGKYEGMVLGHEIAGVVEQMGSSVPASCPIKVGDRVMVYPWPGCGKCEPCLGEETNTCNDNKMGAEEIGQGPHPGGYSTHVPLPRWELAVKVPDNIPIDMASMLPCSALTAWGALNKADAAIQRAIRLRQKANLLVVGAGGLGTWCVNLAKMRYPNEAVRVICADISDEKLANAREVGADATVVWAPSATVDNLVSATIASGKIDAAIDYVGAQRTGEVAFGSLYKGSTLIFVGLQGGGFEAPIPALVGKTISVQGTRTGTLSDLKHLVQFLAEQSARCPPVEYYKLDDINEVINKLEKGKINGRALIKFVD